MENDSKHIIRANTPEALTRKLRAVEKKRERLIAQVRARLRAKD